MRLNSLCAVGANGSANAAATKVDAVIKRMANALALLLPKMTVRFTVLPGQGARLAAPLAVLPVGRSGFDQQHANDDQTDAQRHDESK